MEYLLMMQPVALGLCIGAGILCVIAVIMAGIAMIEDGKELAKKAWRNAIIAGIVWGAALVPANSWDIYKNVLAYRAINSGATDKAVENVEITMDKLGRFLEKWEPGKILDEVEKKAK